MGGKPNLKNNLIRKHQKIKQWKYDLPVFILEWINEYKNILTGKSIYKCIIYTRDLKNASSNWAEIENAGQKSAELYTGAVRSTEDR